MYHIGKRVRHHRLAITTLVVLVVIAFVFGAAWLFNLKTAPRTAIAPPPPAQKQHYSPQAGSPVHISKPLFSLDLPHDWKQIKPAGTPRPDYSFQSPSTGTMLLDIYVDDLPLNMAVNRALPVQAQGSRISHDTVSDNCVSFLPPSSLDSPQAKSKKVVEARWNGVNFWCDTGNYERDVVGTGSAETINKVSLTGASGQTHSVFFTFTDNDISPDFTSFYSILDSFELK